MRKPSDHGVVCGQRRGGKLCQDPPGKFDHIGIAVKSLDESIPFYEKTLGFKCEHREEVLSQKVRTAFFHCGEVHLELLEPMSEVTP